MSAEAQATETPIPVQEMPIVGSKLHEHHRPLTDAERAEKDHEMYRLKREILDEEESLKTSAKARMAITRGTWPTRVAKVDDAIAEVRALRARLDVDVESAEAES
ncbi:MAG: hypothetical protein IT386_11555 [Deltaproteobacteria bacterium]|nr:hypothetical protein [Deltaproteobacteria bacterium]